MKKLSFRSILVIATGATLWVSAHLLLCWTTGIWLKQTIQNDTHADVAIQKIHSNFLNSFHVDNIVVRAPFEAHFSNITLSIRPTFFPVRLFADFKGESGEWGKFVGSTCVGLASPRPWQIRIKVEGFQGDKALAGYIETISKGGRLSGAVDLTGEADGFLKGKGLLANWSIDAQGEHLRWDWTKGQTAVPLSAHLKITPEKITIISANVNRSLKVKGDINSPWTQPTLRLTARSTNASLPALLRAVSPNFRLNSLSGAVSFLVQIEGPSANPSVHGNFTLKPSYTTIHFPTAQGDFNVADKNIELKADFADGRVSLDGSLEATEHNRFHVSLEEVSLATIAKENGWSNVHGTVDSQVAFAFVDDQPTVTGDFRFHHFRWGRFRTKELIAGKVMVNKEAIRFTTQDQSFVLNAMIRNFVVTLNEFLLNFGKDSRIAAKGKANLNDGTMDFSMDGHKIPPDLWPPLVTRYPDITGSLDINGTLRGTINKPQLSGHLAFHGLTFLSGGGSWNGTATLVGSHEKISLSDISVGGGYSGELTWAPSKSSGPLNAHLTLVNADPKLLMDILKSSAIALGNLSGQIQMESKFPSIVGVSSLTWLNGQLADLHFDRWDVSATMQPDKILLEQFSLVNGGQAIRGSGDAHFYANHWDCNATVQLQHWGRASLYIDGETTISGRVEWPSLAVEARLSAPLLWINDYSFENMSAHVEHDGKRWAARGQASNDIHFDVSLDEQDMRVNGTVEDKALRLEEMFAKSISDHSNMPHGSVNLIAKIRGHFHDPILWIDAKTGTVQWREEKFTSQAVVELTSSTISILQSNTKLGLGGSFSLQGRIAQDETNDTNLKGTGSHLNLQSVFHLLGWPVRWEGKTDVTFAMNGPLDDRKIEVEFDGKHDGFGPFPGGGKVTGRVTAENGEWDLSGVRVASGEGYAALLPGSQIFFDRNGAGTMRLVGDTRNLQAGLLTFFGGAEVTGSWKGRSEMDFSERPQIEMDIFARSLWINQFVLDGNVTHLTLKKGDVVFAPIPGSGQQLSGTLTYTDYPTLHIQDFRFVEKGVEKCFLNGFIGPNKWDYALNVKDVDASVASGLFDTTMDLSGPMDLQIKGLGRPKEPDIAATVNWNNGRLDLLPIDSAQCNFRYQNGVIDITDLHAFKKKGYQLSGHIHMNNTSSDQDDRKAEPEVDLVVEKGDFALLRSIWPDISKAKGAFAGRLRIGQKPWGRSISGYLTAQKVQIHSPYTPNLQKGELKIKLDKNRLHIDEASAKLGDGTLKLSGYVDFNNGRPTLYNLSLRTENEKGINIRVPELAIAPGPIFAKFGFLKNRLAGASRGEPLVSLIFKGPADHPLLAGTVELVNTIFTYPPSKNISSEKRKTAFLHWWRSFLDTVRWDVSLVAGARTWYQNELVDANISGQLQFSGPTTDLDINGRIITEQGAIVYSSNEFQIKNAELEVETKSPTINDVETKKTYVYLKAKAEKDVFYTDALSNNNQDTIVMVVDRALLGEIEPRFFSRNNPGLSSERAFQLAMGLPISETIDTNNLLPDQRAQQKSAEDSNKMLRLGLVQLLDASLASPLARAIARNTGLVDYIRVTYQEKDRFADSATPSAADSTSSSNNITQNQFLRYARGTKVKFGRGISNRLFADYSFRVDEFQNKLDLRHEVELAYRVHRNLFLKGITELDSERTLGRPPDRRALLENQWRFGLPRKKLKNPKESKASIQATPATDTKHS